MWERKESLADFPGGPAPGTARKPGGRNSDPAPTSCVTLSKWLDLSGLQIGIYKKGLGLCLTLSYKNFPFEMNHPFQKHL